MEESIDDVILSVTTARWQKVAMVLVRAKSELTSQGHSNDFDQIAERLYKLARSARLDFQGNISNWRSSEVRLPASKEPSDS